MKRISKEEIGKKRIITVVVFAFLILFAIFIVLLPDIFPAPTYDELYEKEIVVSKLERDHIYRAGYVYRVYTTEDEVFNLTGDFEYENIKDILVPGVKAKIRWSENRFIVFPDYAEEVIVNGKIIVCYDNDKPIVRGGYILLSSIIFIIAILVLRIRLWCIKHLQTLQDKRDKRIEKKYRKS